MGLRVRLGFYEHSESESVSVLVVTVFIILIASAATQAGSHWHAGETLTPSRPLDAIRNQATPSIRRRPPLEIALRLASESSLLAGLLRVI